MERTRYNQRDENGWRIPRVGTRSHKMYLLLKEGKTHLEIAKRLKIDTNTAYVSVHKIKNPTYHNRVSHGKYSTRSNKNNKAGKGSN